MNQYDKEMREALEEFSKMQESEDKTDKEDGCGLYFIGFMIFLFIFYFIRHCS